MVFGCHLEKSQHLKKLKGLTKMDFFTIKFSIILKFFNPIWINMIKNISKTNMNSDLSSLCIVQIIYKILYIMVSPQ